MISDQASFFLTPKMYGKGISINLAKTTPVMIQSMSEKHLLPVGGVCHVSVALAEGRQVKKSLCKSNPTQMAKHKAGTL